MSRLVPVVLLLAALGLPGGVSAQTAEPAAPAEGQPAAGDALSMGTSDEAPALGSTYVMAEHGAWDQRCIKTETGNDPCELYQLLRDEQGNAVAEFKLFSLPEGGKAAAGATIITPLETLLTAELRLSVDGSPARRYPYSYCTAVGCFARLGFTAEEVEQFKRGASATVTIVPAAAPDRTVALTASLKGFTAGYAAVAEANAR